MNNIIDYLILTHNHVELPSLVKRFLKDGWELYGTPFVDGPVICQPVIKRLKNE